MRCVSNVRALCRAAPIARRNTGSLGARTCSLRSQARARASSEAVRSSRNASSSRNRASRSPAAASKPVVGTPPQGDLAAVGLEEGGIADQARAGDVGVGDRHGSVREKRAF